MKGARRLPCPVPCKMSNFPDSELKQSTWAFMPVYKLLKASHILHLIPNSKNNLKRRPSIQTVSKALQTSKNRENVAPTFDHVINGLKDGKRSLCATDSLSKSKLHVRKETFIFGKTFPSVKQHHLINFAESRK